MAGLICLVLLRVKHLLLHPYLVLSLLPLLPYTLNQWYLHALSHDALFYHTLAHKAKSIQSLFSPSILFALLNLIVVTIVVTSGAITWKDLEALFGQGEEEVNNGSSFYQGGEMVQEEERKRANCLPRNGLGRATMPINFNVYHGASQFNIYDTPNIPVAPRVMVRRACTDDNNQDVRFVQVSQTAQGKVGVQMVQVSKPVKVHQSPSSEECVSVHMVQVENIAVADCDTINKSGDAASDYEIDAKAEAFIAMFQKKLRLQKEADIRRYRESGKWE